MENQKKNSYPSLPSNYVTLAQLQQRWLNQQTQNQEKQQQPQQHQEEEHETAAGDSVTNRREPDAGAGIGGETADLDKKVAESSKKKRKAWNRNRRRKPNVEEQKGAIEEGSEAAIRSEVNEKNGVDSVKVQEEEGEREFGGSSVNAVKGNQNGRVRRVEQKGVSVGGSRTAIGMVWNEKKRVDSVKVEEKVEQKFRVLTVVKKNQNGRMSRMNKVEQKGESEGGSKTMIGIDLNEKKSADLLKFEEKTEQKFGGLAVKTNQNGGMRRMNKVEQKAANGGGSKTAIGNDLNEKKIVDLVKFEEKVEQEFGGLTVNTNQNGGMRRMNKVEHKAANGGSITMIGIDLNEKKSADLLKVEEEAEQKFGGFSVNSVKGENNGRMRRMNHNGFRHYDSQRNGHGNGYRHGGFNGQHSNVQRGKNDKMVWVRKDVVGAGAGAGDGGEIESET